MMLWIAIVLRMVCLLAIGRHLGEAIEREIAETYDQHKDSNDYP